MIAATSAALPALPAQFLGVDLGGRLRYWCDREDFLQVPPMKPHRIFELLGGDGQATPVVVVELPDEGATGAIITCRPAQADDLAHGAAEDRP